METDGMPDGLRRILLQIFTGAVACLCFSMRNALCSESLV